MAKTIFKKEADKITTKSKSNEVAKKTILVGTYKTDQLSRWPGYYNYPLSAKDKFQAENAKIVDEIWLFQGEKAGKYFSATFIGEFTRKELQDKFAYPAIGKPHGEKYLLFKIQEIDAYEPTNHLFNAVIVRSSDFATSPKIRKQINSYLKSCSRSDSSAAKLIPKVLTLIPREALCVCESAIQLDLFEYFCENANPQHSPNDNPKEKFTCLDFFSGSGLVSVGLASRFSTIWANDISAKKAKVFNANHPAGILHVGSIETILGKDIPLADLSWGSFPCQDLSLAGDMKGLYASRSGLFWQWLRVMDEMPVRPSIVVAENVVGLVSVDNGKYYVVVHNELSKRGYHVGAVMLDAVNWVPQSRKRIFVIGVRKDIEIQNFIQEGPGWCHPTPIVNVAKQLSNWIWWRLPRPKTRQIQLEEIIDFQAPCDSKSSNQEKLKLIPPEKLSFLKKSSRSGRRVFTGYRRTRNHKQVLEVRTDGIAGCLRTPCGGSSRQIVVISDNGILSTRLLTVRETARLMGAPEQFKIPGTYNDGYMAMGDAVAAPVAEYLSVHLLAPIASLSQKEPTK